MPATDAGQPLRESACAGPASLQVVHWSEHRAADLVVRELDVEVISGKSSRSEAGDDEDPDERPEPAGDEAAA